MEVRHVPSLLRFSEEKMQKVGLFDSERFFCDAYCLLPGQEQRLHSHAAEDKVYYVLEGAVTVQVGEEEQPLGPGMAVLAPAGQEHGVRNTGGRPAALLVLMAPRPHR